MINLNEKKECCGCTACYSVCPQKCIQMKQDEEGFLYPTVNKEMCINCSLCDKTCPMKNTNTTEATKGSVYAALQCKNKTIRMESTAGGVFSLFASYLIDNGAIIYACGYNEMVVCHKRTNSKNDLSELRGSKYVQSTLNSTFKMIKNDLRNGGTVLFVGTPCQVHGLKRVVGEADNLFTIDLLCLGVSSPGLFKKWVHYLNDRYSDTVINIQFRNKRYGYSTPNVRVYFEKRKPIEQKYDTRVHSKLFFDGYNVRPSCYECMFREQPRVSDFTIGDFSDIGQYSHKMDDDIGTTRIWVHTEKGKKTLGKVKDEAEILVIEEKNTNVVDDVKRKMQMPRKREEFFDDSRTMDYSSFVSKWEPKTIKDEFIKVFRPLINIFPFHTVLFRFVRNLRTTKFEKNVNRINKSG